MNGFPRDNFGAPSIKRGKKVKESDERKTRVYVCVAIVQIMRTARHEQYHLRLQMQQQTLM